MQVYENFEVHDTLNPLLWENDQLKVSVKERILEIVEHFQHTCDIPLHVVDIRIVGSQASFNYTDMSDLDVHIIANFDLVDCSSEILQYAYNSEKSKFNADYDITIKGVDVELYVEDVRTTVLSNGVYSVIQDRWIKFPQPISEFTQYDLTDEIKQWKKQTSDVIQLNDSAKIEALLDKIYVVRKDSLASEGEFGRGNQLFKELRNQGIIDDLRKAYKDAKSCELTLESVHRFLTEDSRTKLLSRSKQSEKGFQRFKKRVKSRVANSVKQYNSIDMNKLFKQDILTVDVNVKGETDNYVVRITFGGFLELLHDQIEKQQGMLNYKAVTRALILGFNKDDVYIHCSCPDATYRMNFWQTKNGISSSDTPELRPSDITNPDDNLGSACKHVLLVLSNTSWLLKVASTIYNYINYMQKHYEKLYADVIYPAVYGKEYEEPVQLDIFDDDTLDATTDTIDKSNEYARTKNQFKQGNTQGIRFASNDSEQETIDV